MTIEKHADEFAGYPIQDYKPEVGIIADTIARREFRFEEGTSRKFWAITLDGKRHTIQFGKIGTTGQTQTKDFGNPDKAQKAYASLVAEKVGKGYVEVRGAVAEQEPPAPGRKKAATEPALLPVAYRLRTDYDGKAFAEVFASFLENPAVERVAALVIGNWMADFDQGDSTAAVEALVTARARLPHLKALFLGDIIAEENEISWIQQSDISPLFSAFPALEHLRVRGGTGLGLGKPTHKNLRSLVIESGGLPVEVVRQVCAAKLPALEHLELWLGEENYGGNARVEDLKPLLSGKVFPKLQYLGLREHAIADAVAAAVAKAPILKRIQVLDLSLGNLSDAGAEALLASPAVAKLEKLDLHHHFISKPVVKQLQGLGITVDTSEHMEPYDFDPEYRYISVAE